MTFRAIRDSRASRQTKSYVSQSHHVYLVNPITAPSAPIAPTTSVREEPDAQNEAEENAGISGSALQGNAVNEASSSEMTAKPPAEKWYAELPPTLTVKKTKKRGKGLWTNEPIKAGTVLFSVRPRMHVLSSAQLGDYCTSCCIPRPSSGLKKCTNCRVVHYCGASCQKGDWAMHKLECEELKRWAAAAPGAEDDAERIAIPSEAVRCLARIIWKRKKLGSSSMWWKELDEMISHRGNISASMTDSHVHLAHALVRYLGVDGAEELSKYQIRGVGELVDLISKFTSNTFTLTTPSLSPIGVSVSPVTALINHSCDPSVAVVFPRPHVSTLPDGLKNGDKATEPVLQVVAIKDIPANVEIYTSYIDVTLPTAQRQKGLRETYNFTCECAVCRPPEDTMDPREALFCPKHCGGTCSIPLTDDMVVRCTSCGATSEDVQSITDAVRVGQEALDKATAEQFTHPAHALTLTRNIVPLLTRAGLTRASHPLLALQRLYQSLLIAEIASTPSPTASQVNEAIAAAAASVKGLNQLLGMGHPVRALALAELGKLLAMDEPVSANSSDPSKKSGAALFDGSPNGAVPPDLARPPTGPARLQAALKTLQQAHAELRVAFGTASGGGEVGVAVRELIVQLEKETGVWRSGVRDALEDAMAEQRARESARIG